MSTEITRRQALRRTAGLLGGVISAPVWTSFLSGCAAPGDDWSPVVLSPDQVDAVRRIADVIIPETDTPGAAAAGVHRFIDSMVGEGFLEEDRQHFMQGLADLDARCQDRYGAPFVDLSLEEQRAEVAEMDDRVFGPDAPEVDLDDPPFFRIMKELVIVGYYTSEIGASQELKINLVPGRYDGDVPFDEIGRAWAG
jgi:hypothetical protein